MKTLVVPRKRARVVPWLVPSEIEVSVVMPCLNEAETLEACVRRAQYTLEINNIAGEVIVADNGSTDDSVEIAERLGARVVSVYEKGYGSALRGGIAAARGRFVIMGDADQSYDFAHIPRFLEQLRGGSQLVMGNRFRGGIQQHAMPALHRYLGNPVLTQVGRLFFGSPCGDFNCGMRGFSKKAYEAWDLQTNGMEFAVEMIVKATLLEMKISEVPTTLAPDGRTRPPHLRTWRDGWRTLRFFLLYSPRWLFLYPGLALILLGGFAGLWLLPGPQRIGGVVIDVHTLLYAALAILLGFQSVAFAVFTKIFAIAEGLLPRDPALEKTFRHITLETGLGVGSLLAILGLGLSGYAVYLWEARNYGAMEVSHTLRLVIPAALALTLGVQTIFSSFFLSVLGLRRR